MAEGTISPIYRTGSKLTEEVRYLIYNSSLLE